ncbi:MAG: hypothetical protein R2845_12245 [Thermomicrobiales bacterium]
MLGPAAAVDEIGDFCAANGIDALPEERAAQCRDEPETRSGLVGTGSELERLGLHGAERVLEGLVKLPSGGSARYLRGIVQPRRRDHPAALLAWGLHRLRWNVVSASSKARR